MGFMEIKKLYLFSRWKMERGEHLVGKTYGVGEKLKSLVSSRLPQQSGLWLGEAAAPCKPTWAVYRLNMGMDEDMIIFLVENKDKWEADPPVKLLKLMEQG
jgi:hypothetical protein